LDVLTVGEVLAEFLRKGKDERHDKTGEYAGPFPSGAPAIFADTAARLGLESSIVGCTGKDEFGRLIRNRLRSDHVNVKYLKTSSQKPTGIAFVAYRSSGERQFLFHLKHSAAAQVKPEDITADFLRTFRALHITGSSLSLAESMRNACYKAAKLASRFGMIVSFDPNLRTELTNRKLMHKLSKPLLNAANLLMPSRQELYDLSGHANIDDAVEEMFKHGIECVVVKLGSDGSIARSDEGKVLEAGYHVQELDPTGAGDAYDAAIILGYLRKWKLQNMLEFANAVGAMKVTRFGPMAVPMSVMEVREFMRRNSDTPNS
jgi:sugar/nucleoside kinase (ribokinase family)